MGLGLRFCTYLSTNGLQLSDTPFILFCGIVIDEFRSMVVIWDRSVGTQLVGRLFTYEER
jgi:hypothetical protein